LGIGDNTMNIQDALNILAVTPGNITPEDIKKAYRKACSKYHPDRNPAGLEMTKLINIAYEAVKYYQGEYSKKSTKDYGDIINNALNAVIHLGLTVEICGAWIWLSGNTKPHRETLKSAKFSWSPKKLQWYFRPDKFKSRNRTSWSMDKIRTTYGSKKVDSVQRHLQADH
jgi:hypothetical protein